MEFENDKIFNQMDDHLFLLNYIFYINQVYLQAWTFIEQYIFFFQIKSIMFIFRTLQIYNMIKYMLLFNLLRQKLII